MKKLLPLLLCLGFACFCAGAATSFAAGYGDVYVNGYQRNDGTDVQPHYRSYPDGNQYNNYSQPGYSSPGYQRQDRYDERQSGNAPWPALGNPCGRPSQQRSGGSMLR